MTIVAQDPRNTCLAQSTAILGIRSGFSTQEALHGTYRADVLLKSFHSETAQNKPQLQGTEPPPKT